MQYFDNKIAEYEAYDVVDPQSIPDDEFFGVWDGSRWTKTPYFAYDRFSGLAEVEAAAKTGHYTLAKEKILAYYRQRMATEQYEDTETKSSKPYRLWAEMAMENLILRPDFGLPMERITLSTSSRWVETDILERLQNILSTTTSTSMNIRIHAVHKDGYMGQFNTKESTELDGDGKSTSPYVTMVVNGNTRTYYPVADNTIRAGQFFSTSYSSEPVMLAGESYTTIGAASPVDDYSRRGALLFNFSDLKDDDTITFAKLYLYGKMVEDDNPIRPSETKTSMDLFVVDDRTNLVWTEAGHSWSQEGFDICFSYDGEYGPSICTPTALSGQWSASVMAQYYLVQYLLQLYRGTGNEAYAYHAIRFTVNSALKLAVDPSQTTQPMMQAATRMSTFARNIYTMIRSEHMTPEYFTILLKYVYIHNEYMVADWSESEESNNIGAIVTRGLLESSMTFYEFSKYYAPKTALSNSEWGGSIQGGWLAVGLYRSVYKLRGTVLPDGSCVEVPMGYVITNLSSFFSPYEWAETLGRSEEIVDNVSQSDKELLRQAAYYMASLQNPVGGTWQSGDDSPYTSRCAQNAARYARYFVGDDDPVLEWMSSYGEKGNPPQGYTSYANDTVMKSTLRSSWQEDAVALYIDADGGYKSHSHNDDLAVGLMAYGTYFLSDPLKYLYNGDQKIIKWQVSSRAHNVVEINDTASRGGIAANGLTEEPFGYELYFPNSMGELGSLHPENREFNDGFDFLRAETKGYINNSSAKGDFQYWRDVLFVKPGYFIVTDYIKPENNIVNRYSQAWHIHPELTFEIEEGTKNVKTTSGTTANLVVAPVEDNHPLEVQEMPGYYSFSANTAALAHNPYVSYVKNQTGVTTFNTVLYPMRAGENKSVETQQLPLSLPDEAADAFEAVIRDNNAGSSQNLAYYTLFDETQKSQQQFGSYSTDGILGFVEKTGTNYTHAILRSGTNLSTAQGTPIISSGSEIENMSVTWSGNQMSINSSTMDAVDLDSLKILGNANVKQVLVNGAAATFFRDGDYIRFTDLGGGSTPTPGAGTDSGNGNTHATAGGRNA